MAEPTVLWEWIEGVAEDSEEEKENFAGVSRTGVWSFWEKTSEEAITALYEMQSRKKRGLEIGSSSLL